MLKTRNGRNERRREGQSLSLPIMPPKLRKMAFLQSGHLLLKIFLNKFRPKSPRLAGKGSIFYFDIFPMQFVSGVGVWFAAANIQYMEHPPFSLKWVQAGFFLFPCVKEALDGQSAAADSLNTACLVRGHHYNRQKNHRRRFSAVVRGLQKVYKDREELCGEKLENKADCKTSHSFFISSFRA